MLEIMFSYYVKGRGLCLGAKRYFTCKGIFSGCLQAFIFAMLTMLYVAGGFPAEEYFKRQKLKNSKKTKLIRNSEVM